MFLYQLPPDSRLKLRCVILADQNQSKLFILLYLQFLIFQLWRVLKLMMHDDGYDDDVDLRCINLHKVEKSSAKTYLVNNANNDSVADKTCTRLLLADAANYCELMRWRCGATSLPWQRDAAHITVQTSYGVYNYCVPRVRARRLWSETTWSCKQLSRLTLPRFRTAAAAEFVCE